MVAKIWFYLKPNCTNMSESATTRSLGPASGSMESESAGTRFVGRASATMGSESAPEGGASSEMPFPGLAQYWVVHVGSEVGYSLKNFTINFTPTPNVDFSR